MFKHLTIALLVAGLASCGPLTPPANILPPVPNAYAQKTVLDEQAALAVELAYQASALAMLGALRSGLVTGEVANRLGEADQKAYAAVQLVRAAYDTGNAASYAGALSRARELIAQTLSLAKGTAQ